MKRTYYISNAFRNNIKPILKTIPCAFIVFFSLCVLVGYAGMIHSLLGLILAPIAVFFLTPLISASIFLIFKHGTNKGKIVAHNTAERYKKKQKDVKELIKSEKKDKEGMLN